MAKKFEVYGIKEPGTIIHPKLGRINLHEASDEILAKVAETDPHLVRAVVKEPKVEEKPNKK